MDREHVKGVADKTQGAGKLTAMRNWSIGGQGPLQD